MNGEEFPVHHKSMEIGSNNFNFKYSHEKNQVFICTMEGNILLLDLFNFELQEVYSNSKYEFKIIEIYENYLLCFTEHETLILKDKKEYFTFKKQMTSVELFDDGFILWYDNQNVFKIKIHDLIEKIVNFQTVGGDLFYFDYIKKIGNDLFVVDFLFGGTEIFEYPCVNHVISLDHIDVKSVTHDKDFLYFGYDSFVEKFDSKSWKSMKIVDLKIDVQWIIQHESILIVKLLNGLHFMDKETLEERCSVYVEPKSKIKFRNEKYVEFSKDYFMFSNLKILEIWKFPNNTRLKNLLGDGGRSFDLFFQFH
jgi:hypothetical protein